MNPINASIFFSTCQEASFYTEGGIKESLEEGLHMKSPMSCDRKWDQTRSRYH